MNCPNCGNPILSGAFSCALCGQEIETELLPSDLTEKAPDALPVQTAEVDMAAGIKKRLFARMTKKRMVMALLAFLCVVIVVGISIFFFVRQQINEALADSQAETTESISKSTGNFTQSNTMDVEEGACGENAKYKLYSNGFMEIYGNGEIIGCAYENSVYSATNIVIKPGITSIGEDAFSGSSALKKIYIPDSVEQIGACAFSNCTALASVTLSENVTTIGYFAFIRCTELKEIFIPNSVTMIMNSFNLCTNITLVCPSGSYANHYAERNNINFRLKGQGSYTAPENDRYNLSGLYVNNNSNFSYMPKFRLSPNDKSFVLYANGLEYIATYTGYYEIVGEYLILHSDSMDTSLKNYKHDIFFKITDDDTLITQQNIEGLRTGAVFVKTSCENFTISSEHSDKLFMEGTIRKCTDGTAKYILEFDHPINLAINHKDGTAAKKNGLIQARITVDQAYSYNIDENAEPLHWPLNKLIGTYVIVSTEKIEEIKIDGDAVVLDDVWLW